MAYQTNFQRYELKYMLTRQQRELLLRTMRFYMGADAFGHTTIRNIYFDTDTYRLIRSSLEKPLYKEKLRLRSYAMADASSPVFVELKKKYRSVVYKRRLALPEGEAMGWLCGDTHPAPTQITAEIDYLRSFYGTLRPVVFLSYERDAFAALDGSDFRVTFDEGILAREEGLSLRAGIGGAPLLGEDTVLMELKTSGGIPLWMTRFLTQQHICKTTFSKYGEAYRRQIFPGVQKGTLYA